MASEFLDESNLRLMHRWDNTQPQPVECGHTAPDITYSQGRLGGQVWLSFWCWHCERWLRATNAAESVVMLCAPLRGKVA